MPRQNKKSFVWEAFTKIDESNVKCNSCSTVYKLFGTTNLICHLKRKHPVLYLELTGAPGENRGSQQTAPPSSSSAPVRPNTSNQLSVNSISCRPTTNNKRANEGSLSSPQVEQTGEAPAKRPRQMRIVPPTRINQKSVDDALVEMIALDYQPLQIVENAGFKNFTSKLNPDYSLPSRKTLSHKLVHDKYAVCSDALKEILNDTDVENVSMTTDMWTSDSNKAYLTVTVHFVHEAQLKSFILSTVEVLTEHNAENIAEALKSVANEWNVFHKIIAFVTDNASTIKKAVNDLQKRNIYCVAHTLNLTVKDCIAPKDHSDRDEIKQQITDLLSKCRSVVGHFRHSSKSSYKLKETQKQMGLPELKLKQDVVTRWNATLYMVERLIKLKIPLSATLPQIQTTVSNLESSQWDLLDDIASLLGPFEKMTVVLSGELYPSLSSVIPLVRGLQNVLRKKVLKTEAGLHLKELLISVVSKRLNVYETNRTAAKATFLDPRFKKKGFGLDSNADIAQQWVVDELSAIMRQQTKDKQGSRPVETEPIPVINRAEEVNDEDDLWECLDKKVAEVANAQTPTSSALVAVNQYLDMPYLERKQNPLVFWDERKNLLPSLTKMAYKYLCIPATSVPSERIFSKAGLVTNDRRNRLNPKKLNEILFLNGWFTAQRKQ